MLNHLDELQTCCDRTGSEGHLRFLPKAFYHHHFPADESSEQIPERTSTEGTRVGAPRGFLILRQEAGPEFYRKLAQILSQIRSQNQPEFFQPLFTASKNPRQIH